MLSLGKSFFKVSKITNRKIISDDIVITILMCMSFLPSFGVFFKIRFGILIILFFLKLFQNEITLNKQITIIMVMMLLSTQLTLVYLSLFEFEFNENIWFHEFQRIIYYCILISIIFNCKVKQKNTYIICVFCVLVNFFIQCVQWLHISEMNALIRKYYLEPNADGRHLLLAYAHGINFRSGSIFMNPNIYMVIPCLTLCVVIQHYIVCKNVYDIIFMIISIFSAMLTGSRTALICIACILFWGSIYIKKIKIFLFTSLILLIVVLFFNGLIENYRFFELNDALEKSGNAKIKIIVDYLINARFIYYFIGSLGVEHLYFADCEWGHIIIFYGILGVVWYVMIIACMLRNKLTINFQVYSSVMLLCLIACTATVIFCMPISNFYMCVVLPKYIE